MLTDWSEEINVFFFMTNVVPRLLFYRSLPLVMGSIYGNFALQAFDFLRFKEIDIVSDHLLEELTYFKVLKSGPIFGAVRSKQNPSNLIVELEKGLCRRTIFSMTEQWTGFGLISSEACFGIVSHLLVKIKEGGTKDNSWNGTNDIIFSVVWYL